MFEKKMQQLVLQRSQHSTKKINREIYICGVYLFYLRRQVAIILSKPATESSCITCAAFPMSAWSTMYGPNVTELPKINFCSQL